MTAVVFPEPRRLTTRICDAIDKFLEMLRTNSVHQELLCSRSTYENYFGTPEVEA